MQYGVAFLFVLLGFGCMAGVDHLIGTYVGLSLLIAGALYVLPWHLIFFWFHLIPVRGESTMADEWGELWACLRWGALYAAILMGVYALQEKYNPDTSYNMMMVDESSGMPREEAIRDFEKWQASGQKPPQ